MACTGPQVAFPSHNMWPLCSIRNAAVTEDWPLPHWCNKGCQCFCYACRPQRHPDLQILRDLTYWDSVIVVGIPHHTNASDPPPPTDAANLTGGDLSPNSSQESPPKRTEQLLSATSDAVSGAVSQTVDEEVNAKSVLILGLCGHNHDLER